MRTAVVVVPRERFTSLPVSLRSLFATAAETTYARPRRYLGKERFRSWVVARMERKVVDEQLSLRSVLTASVPRTLQRADIDRAIADLVDAPAGALGSR